MHVMTRFVGVPATTPTPATVPSFHVHDVEIGPKLAVIPTNRVRDAWGHIGKLLVCSPVRGDLPAVAYFDSPNLLAACVYKAFYEHYPVKLNPNSIWLTICQGFGTYVDANAEALRSKFVSFEGQKFLTVERPDFVRDYWKNDWEKVFPVFVSQITGYIGKPTAQLLDCNFSNTTLLDKAAAHITVMDIMKHYFKYVMRGGCGIPYIELLGTTADWVLVRKKAEALRTYELSQDNTLQNWLADLLPVLDHFVLAAQGKPDIAFWGAVCNVLGRRGSGIGSYKGDPLNGWMQVFFPYVRNAGRSDSRPVRNCYVSEWRRAYEVAHRKGVEVVLVEALRKEEIMPRGQVPNFVTGMQLKDIPSGLSRAPVEIKWRDGQKPPKENVHFYAGLVSIHQHPDGSLEVIPGDRKSVV